MIAFDWVDGRIGPGEPKPNTSVDMLIEQQAGDADAITPGVDGAITLDETLWNAISSRVRWIRARVEVEGTDV